MLQPSMAMYWPPKMAPPEQYCGRMGKEGTVCGGGPCPSLRMRPCLETLSHPWMIPGCWISGFVGRPSDVCLPPGTLHHGQSGQDSSLLQSTGQLLPDTKSMDILQISSHMRQAANLQEARDQACHSACSVCKSAACCKCELICNTCKENGQEPAGIPKTPALCMMAAQVFVAHAGHLFLRSRYLLEGAALGKHSVCCDYAGIPSQPANSMVLLIYRRKHEEVAASIAGCLPVPAL